MVNHAAFLVGLGVAEETISALTEDWRSASLADKTRAILEYAEQVTKDATQVGDDGIARLREAGCTDEEIIEATAVAAYFNYMDRIADALGVALDELPG